MVEGLGEQNGGEGFDQLRVGDGPVRFFVGGDAGLGVVVVFAAKAEDQVRDGLAKRCVLFGIRGLERCERATPVFSSSPALATKRSALAW